MKSSVWSRDSGDDELSKGFFILTLCFWVAAGIATSAVGAYAMLDYQIGLFHIIALALISFVGGVIAYGSESPLVSLLGYMLVTVPLGMLLGPVVNQYTGASVVRIFFVTTAVVMGLGLIGILIPDNLAGWGSWLAGGLLVLLVGYFAVPLAGFIGIDIGQALSILDWVGIVLFSAYVIYDLNKAMHVPRNLDNAIDCALAIYLDFVNLFIRFLAQRGTKKSE